MKIKKDYIKLLIRKCSLKQKEVAAKINVSTQDWNNWMFRGVFPHYDRLEALATLLKVDVDELIDSQEVSDDELDYASATRQISNQHQIPYFAGDQLVNHKLFDDFNENHSASDYITLPGINGHLAISAFGKDMHPVISSGDLIILRKVNDLSFFNYGNVYLIRTQHQSIIRYVRKSERPNTIKLIAENPLFDSFEIPKRKITSAFLVLTTIKQNCI